MAVPAHAHGRAADATNYDSAVTHAPALEGVTWAVYGGDELLSVTNTTETALTVFGYDDEPYSAQSAPTGCGATGGHRRRA